MKQTNKSSINCFKIFLVLLAALAFGSGCAAPKPAPNPLAGWKVAFNKEPDQTITKDYQEYIQDLPAGERIYARVSQYLEDGTGRHAIVIEIALNGTWWNHILIYDENDKRVKVIKYSPGGYQS